MSKSLILFLALASSRLMTTTSIVEHGVSDRVVLRDGTVVLGQIFPSPSSRVELIVCRSWAEAHLPEQLARWIERDLPNRTRAIAERIERLRQWRQERRPPGVAGPDPIGTWIEAELTRLEDPLALSRFPLIVVSFPRGEVSRIESRPEAQRRMLRQGWRARFLEVETMPEAQLRAGLEDRGFAPVENDPAPIDDLLPIPLELDRRWLARRASTEVLTDPDLRLIRFGELVLPDPGSGGAIDQIQMTRAVGNLLGSLLGNGPMVDPARTYLDAIEASGRVGVVVTQLMMTPEFDRVVVESTLLIRTGVGRWEVGTRRQAEVRTADLPPEAGRPLGDDPQVRAVIELLQGFGLGRVDAEGQRLSLAVGAATQKALEEARSALEADLRSVAFRIGL